MPSWVTLAQILLTLMANKELDAIMTRLQSASEHKKQIALAKANMEIEAIQREANAYWDGVYDAIKELSALIPERPANEK